MNRARNPVSHEDLADRLDRGDDKFAAIEQRLQAIEEKQDRTNELLEAWVAVKGTGSFIIWLGKVFGGWAVILTALAAATKFRLWTAFGGN